MKYKVKINFPLSDFITFIESENKYMINGYVIYPENYPEIFEQIKEPLFITEDGVELFDLTDVVFGVCPKGSWETNYYCGLGIPLDIMDLRDIKRSWVYFSTKESAETWIKENKPKFSEKQLNEAKDKAFTSIYGYIDYDKFIKELGL